MRARGVAAIALVIPAIAGCGGGTAVTIGTAPTSSRPTTTVNSSGPGAPSSRSASSRYCQRLDDGRWVTNDRAFSTTPCVPDPSYASGDERADGALALPRCFTCKLSDWERAERRAKKKGGEPTGTSNTDTTAPQTLSLAAWPATVRQSFIDTCAESGDDALCECAESKLANQIPADQASSLSADDPRIRSAFRNCRS
jgi:hypothetical protein